MDDLFKRYLQVTHNENGLLRKFYKDIGYRVIPMTPIGQKHILSIPGEVSECWIAKESRKSHSSLTPLFIYLNTMFYSSRT